MKILPFAIRSSLLVGSASLLLSGCASTYPNYDDLSYNQTQTQTAQKQTKQNSPPKRTYSFPQQRAATGNKVFIFDPSNVAWAAYDANGQLVKQGAASGGRGYCPDIKRSCRTPVGSFKVTRKKGPNCKSSKYPLGKGGAPMPNCMFFHHGYSIHGSGDVPNYNASHGCVRVPPSDAAWLSNNFINIGTKVVVLPY